jgi:thymidine kinase
MSPYLSGNIEVICGPMFSGKSEELIRRVRRAQIGRLKVQTFKPGIDDRYSKEDIVSHSSQAVRAVPVKDSMELLSRVFDSTRVVAIDEVQFFDADIVKIVAKLARRGVRVICAGLDQDYRGEPFGPIPSLLAIADDVTKVHAVCTVCGAPATKTYRKDPKNSDQVLVGETDLYEARCRAHFDYFDDEDLLAYTKTVGAGAQEVVAQ